MAPHAKLTIVSKHHEIAESVLQVCFVISYFV